MSKYAIAYSPITSKIQVGRLNKKGNMFLDDKEYHTDEATYAVIQRTLADFDGALRFTVGDKVYEVEVRDISND